MADLNIGVYGEGNTFLAVLYVRLHVGMALAKGRRR